MARRRAILSRVLMSALVPLLGPRAHAQEIAPPDVTAVVEDAAAATKPDDFIYVATTSQDRIGRVMMPVFVNDVGPFAFLVDTGASSSVLAPGVATRLGLVADRNRVKLLRGITGSEHVPTVLVRKISAGGITLEGSVLPVVAPRVFADADGIFGADAFAGGCLHIALADARVSILQRGCPRLGDSWDVIPAQFKFGGLPIVSADVGNVKVVGIIDTGAERSLGNPALLAAIGRAHLANDPKTLIQVYAATSQPVYGNVVEAPKLSLGTIDIANLHAIFGPFEVFRMWGVENEPALVIGMDVLGSVDGLMIDFRRSQVRVLPRVPAGRVMLRDDRPATRIRH